MQKGKLRSQTETEQSTSLKALEATRALGKRDSTSVYVMVANGKARFVHEEEEEEEEKFYDALKHREWQREEKKASRRVRTSGMGKERGRERRNGIGKNTKTSKRVLQNNIPDGERNYKWIRSKRKNNLRQKNKTQKNKKKLKKS